MKRKNSEKFSKSKALQDSSGTSKQPLLTCNTCVGEQEGGNSPFRSSVSLGLTPISFWQLLLMQQSLMHFRGVTHYQFCLQYRAPSKKLPYPEISTNSN